MDYCNWIIFDNKTKKIEHINYYSTAANSVYNQLLGCALQAVSLWFVLVYLDTESLWQRN
jgi:hypothetical protein